MENNKDIEEMNMEELTELEKNLSESLSEENNDDGQGLGLSAEFVFEIFERIDKRKKELT
ncbi:MAG: hypothetical protein WCO58_01075 [bacterium]